MLLVPVVCAFSREEAKLELRAARLFTKVDDDLGKPDRYAHDHFHTGMSTVKRLSNISWQVLCCCELIDGRKHGECATQVHKHMARGYVVSTLLWIMQHPHVA